MPELAETDDNEIIETFEAVNINGRKKGGQFAKVEKPLVKVGPKSKYEPRFCQMIVDYFNKPGIEYETVQEWHNNGKLKKKTKVPLLTNFPTFQMFAARECGVTMQTLYNWKAEYPEFAHAYNLANDMQMGLLAQLGLAGHYNAQVMMFLSKNFHNMKDKNDEPIKADFELTIKHEYVNRPIRDRMPDETDIIDCTKGREVKVIDAPYEDVEDVDLP